MDRKKLFYYSWIFILILLLFNFKHLPPWAHIIILSAMAAALFIGAFKMESDKKIGKATLISGAISGLSFASFIAVQKYFPQYMNYAGTLAFFVLAGLFLAVALAFIGFVTDKSKKI